MPRSAALARALLLAAALPAGGPMAPAQSPDPPRIRAPEFPAGAAWLNTAEPLRLRDLRGQVVLLDFWTYCCINCMHVLPDLEYLERKYRDEPFVVIGVHSGKFSREKDPENIRQAMLRHDITHPVIVDSDYAVWNAYTARAWPTFVLIDPQGYIVGTLAGEGHRAALDGAIDTLLREHRRLGSLGTPRAHDSAPATPAPQPLRFPGKILADVAGQRLFISDTGQHRVLITDFDGKVRKVIGAGQPGLRDGQLAVARFRRPQGLALSADGRMLYVADTRNHALRGVDLECGEVRTLAGTGRQAEKIYPGSKAALQTALSSPWDVALVGDRVFIAMAGPHQIWVYDPRTRKVRVHAGTGAEAARDGPNEEAAFAQPSGLATDGTLLFVADAESSSIRAVDVRAHGRTRTLAGSGDLFGFGDQDGVGAAARFQHPLGLAVWGDVLLIADTYNDSIRALHRSTGAVTTWRGVGGAQAGVPTESQARPEEGCALAEPGGLSIAGDTLYIADTNNHRVVVVQLASGAARVLDVHEVADRPEERSR